MIQFRPVDFAARPLAHDFVEFIDEVKDFFGDQFAVFSGHCFTPKVLLTRQIVPGSPLRPGLRAGVSTG